MELLGVLAIAVIGYLLLRKEWLDGRITLPLRDNSALVQQIAAYALKHPIVEGHEPMSEVQLASDAIYSHQFESFLQDKLDQHQFPRARVHDLKQEVARIVEASPIMGYASQGYHVRKAFENAAELHDNRARAWSA